MLTGSQRDFAQDTSRFQFRSKARFLLNSTALMPAVGALAAAGLLAMPGAAFAQSTDAEGGNGGGGGGGGAGGDSVIVSGGTGTAGGNGVAAGSGGGGGGTGITGGNGGTGFGGTAGGVGNNVFNAPAGNGANATVAGNGGGGGAGASTRFIAGGSLSFPAGNSAFVSGGTGGSGMGSGSGGGGGAGATFVGSLMFNAAISAGASRTGGAGGAGGNGGVSGNGGDGGDGGDGFTVVLAGTNTIEAGAFYTGGAGGAGGSGVVAGLGGVGGAGLNQTGGALVNQGTLRGGAGGTGSVGGLGGIGFIGSGVTINNTGTIAGGLSGGGGVQALAMRLSGTSTVTNIGTLTGGVEIASGTTTFDIASDQTLANVVSGAGAVAKAGTGTLTLSGANTYTGLTTVSAGTLRIENGFALGASSAGTVVQDGATLEFGSGSPITVTDALTLTGTGVGGRGALVNVAGNNSVTGLVTLAGDTLISTTGGALVLSGSPVSIEGNGHDLTLNNDGASAIVNASINNIGALIKNGDRNTALFGNNTFAGPVTINGGSLQLISTGALKVANAVTINSGFLQVARDVTIGSVGGAGILSVDTTTSGPQSTLTTGGDNSSTELSGMLTGRGTLIKAGTGTFTLSGTNGLSGGITVNSGTLQIGNGGTSGALGSGAVTNNATLTINRSDAFTVSNAITGTGSLVKAGAGNLTLASNLSLGGTLTVDAGTLTLTGTNSFTQAASINGALSLQSGVTLSNSFGILGSNSGQSGTATVTGTGSMWTLAQTLVVGLNGTGGLTISAGGAVISNSSGGTLFQIASQTGSQGTVLVTGAGSRTETVGQIAVGQSGRGELTIAAGGFASNTLTTLGRFAVGSGTALVTGSGSRWEVSQQIQVGSLGQGTVTIADGGYISSVQGAGSGSTLLGVFEGASGTALVTGNGSLWENDGIFTVGRDGTGILTVADGGEVSATNIEIARNATSTGTLNIGAAEGKAAAAAGTLTTPTLTFGAGTGTLVFNHTDTDLALAAAISGTGTIRHLAGTTSLSGDSSSFAGTTTVAGGTLLVTGSLGGTINVTGGMLGGTGTFGDLTIGLGGSLNPGQSPGTLMVGSLTLDAGSLTTFELSQAGVAGGANNDLIRVTGALTLNGGTIDIVQGMGFSNGRYTLFEFGSLAGALGNLSLNPLSGGFVGTLALDGNTVVLNAAPPEDLIFWNGSTLAPTGAVVGGSGTWNLVNGNFTEDDGDFTGAWAGNGFNAVFAGTGGTVTIGADTTVAPSGLAFQVDGYTINGGNAASRLELTGPTGIDTAAAVGATINAVISGTGSLTKTGTGTLTLGGVNTYTGSTTVLGGTLVNSGTITGSVINNVTFTSTGSLFGGLTNNASAVANLAGTANGQISNSGTVNVTGNLTNNGALFANSGAGVLNVSGGDFTGINVVTNNSTALNGINVSAGRTLSAAIITNGATSSILNSGTITASVRIDNSGTLTTTGTINGGSTGLRGLAGSTTNASGTINGAITNAGTFNVTGNLVTDNFITNTGTLNLTGATLTTAALSNNAGGVVNARGTLNGGVQNSGTFNVTGNLANTNPNASYFGFDTGVLNVSDGDYTGLVVVNNSSTATNGVNISAGRTLSAQIVSNGTNSSFLNAGTITATNRIDNSGTLTTTGTINVGTFGLRGLAGSTTNASGTINGAITNAGTFNVTGNLVNDNVITNTGTLNLTGATLTTAALFNNAGATASLRGAINGAFTNSGTVTVTGGLTVNGAVTQNSAGTFNLSGFTTSFGSLAGSGTVDLGAATLTVGGNGTSTSFGGAINGTGGLIKTGAGNFTLAGTNGYTGQTRIDEGTLATTASGVIAGQVRNSGTFNNSGTVNGSVVNLATLTSSGTISGGLTQFAGATGTVSGTLNGFVNNAGTLTVNGNLASNDFGQITGMGQVTVQSGARWSGLLGFTNLSTNAAGLSIAGTLDVSGIFVTQSGAATVIASGGTLTAQNSTNLGTVTNNGTVNTDVTNGSGNIVGTIVNNGTWNGTLSQGLGSVTNAGRWNGNFLLDVGAQITNSGTWDTTSPFGSALRDGTFDNTGSLIGLGFFVTGPNARLNNGTTGTITLNAGQAFNIDAGGRIDNLGTASASANVNAGGILRNFAGASWTGAVTIQATGSVSNSGTITGNVGNMGTFASLGTVNGNLTNGALGLATLAGTLDGNISNSGRIQLVGTTTGIDLVTQMSTGVFELSGFDTTFTGLQGAGQVMLGGGDLTVNAVSSTTFSGVISGNGSLIKSGTGTLTLSGANTYTGPTSLLGGTLAITNAAALSSGALMMADGTTLRSGAANLTLANAIDITGTGTIDSGTNQLFTLGGVISGGTLNQTGAGGSVLTLSGTNTYTGGTVLNGAFAMVSRDANLGAATGAVTFNGGATLIFANTAAFNSTRNFIGNSNINLQTTGTAPVTLGGVVSGDAGLLKQGAGELILTNANTYQGGTGLFGGVITVANNRALGTGQVTMLGGTTLRSGAADLMLANAIDITGTGTIDSGTNQLFTLGGVISGGTLNQTGAGGSVLTLSGTNTYTGGTVLNGAFTAVSRDANLGAAAGAVTFNGGATLVFANTAAFNSTRNFIGNSNINLQTIGTAPVTLGGVVSGASGLLKQGAGELILTNANTYQGGTGLFGGVLTVANSRALGTGQVTMFGSTTLRSGAADLTLANNFDISGTSTIDTAANAFTLSGVIGGSGGFIKIGEGTLTLTGVNTYTGTTFVNAGTLVVGEDGVVAPPPAATVAPAPTLAAVTAQAIEPAIAGGPAQTGRGLLVGGNGSLTGGRTSVSLEPAATLAVVETAPVIAAVAGEAPVAPQASIAAQSGMLAQAVIAGNVVNSATLINNGTILGMVINNAGASASNHGVIEGPVRNDGTLVSTGTLGGGLMNNGQAQIEGVLDGDVINTGTITLTGITTGIDFFEQAAGGVFDLAGFDTTLGAIMGAGSITLGDARLTTGTDGVGTVFGGVISGTGSLAKVGTGRLVLTGANTYTGGTTISGGVLQLGNGGTSGSIVGPVMNNGALVINRSDAFTFANAISGTGMFVQDGSGTTTLTGTNSYSGGTLISSGRLVGNTTSLQGRIQNNAALEFAQASAGIFAGQLFGAGLFDKTGLGLLDLTGNNNGFTGGTFVRGGELRVSGQLANSVVTVLSGSTLSGSGTIGGLIANSGSTIAPGANGAGVLGVNGAVILQAGSTVQLQIRAGGPSDAIVSNGAATLGGTAAFSNLGGVYAFNSEIVLLQADGGRTGTFASTTGFGSFGILYRPELVYTATQARLRFAPNLLANIVGNTALTANQRSVVNRIDGAVTAGYNPQPLFNVYALPTAQLPGAFDQLSGEVYASTAGVGIEQERLVREAVLGRVNAVAMAARGDAAAGKGAGAWAQVFGGGGQGDNDGNAARIETDRTGFATGIDFGNANENGSWRAGVFGMQIQSDVTIDARGSSAEVEQSGGGVYASLSTGGFTATLGGYLTSVDLTASRTIALPGFAEVNNGETGGEARQAFAEVSFTIPSGKGMVRPFLGATIGSFDLDAFTETGGAAALTMREQSYSTGTLTAGVDGMLPVGKSLTLFGTLAGRAQLGDRAPQAQLALAAAPQQAFGVAGAQFDEVAVAARLDASLKLGKNVDFSVGYTGLIGSTISDHGARATLQVQF